MPSEPVRSSPASAVSSFASLLASLTAPKPPASDLLSEDLLADDVATISYERALRAHARYHRADPLPDPDPHAQKSEQEPDLTVPKPPQSVRITEWVSESEVPPNLAASRKTASITIRLSQAECAQLHQRAADAGLTLSAYLRSCLFEVEALRAQVKETLMRLRSRAGVEPQAAPAQPEGPSRGWRDRLLSGLHLSRNAADA